MKGAQSTEVTADHKNDICVTTACIESALRSLKYLDSAVNPCTDFYSFACGKYIDELENLENITHKSISILLQEISEKQIRLLVKEPLSKNPSKPQITFKTLYDICINDKLSKPGEISNAKSILKSLNKWPMLSHDWKNDDFNFMEIIKILRKRGLPSNFFFGLGVDVNTLGNLNHILYINFEDIFYVDSMVDLYTIINDTLESKEDFKNFKKFESEFLRVTIFYAIIVKKDANLDIASISRLQNLTSDFNWLVYLQNAVQILTFTLNDRVLIENVHQLTKVAKLILRTPKRTLANYIFIMLYNWMYTYFTKINPSVSECVSTVSISMPLLLSSLYVRKYFDENKKAAVREMVLNLRDEFMNILKTVDWLDEKTRARAVEKLNAMGMCIGYPDELLEDESLGNYYKNLTVDFTSYLNAMISVNLFNQDQLFARLLAPVDGCHWVDNSKDITLINAYYLVLHNRIMLPAAFLQNLLFDSHRPHYVNYAVAGMIVGHEITHGFDNEGKNYDKNGKPVNWWSEQSSKEFKNRAKCIINQYQKYKIPKLNVSLNGEITQGENIADNGGLKQSYLAYNNWVKRNNVEKSLPGLNYTTNQLFWISFAQFWCSYDGIEYLKVLLTDPHPPSRLRVIGTLSNSESFSKDFNCPLDSPMNPKNKCKVW
ncbi:hypothetical protein FQA39_LY17254 [Lamprigera yunnana]|nr:hypothetical protein FQA39_LY17254 [Lamprigera yunnana]